jgi:hypothetical protein
MILVVSAITAHMNPYSLPPYSILQAAPSCLCLCLPATLPRRMFCSNEHADKEPSVPRAANTVPLANHNCHYGIDQGLWVCSCRSYSCPSARRNAPSRRLAPGSLPQLRRRFRKGSLMPVDPLWRSIQVCFALPFWLRHPHSIGDTHPAPSLSKVVVRWNLIFIVS